ncbi:hypothetical protein TNCV_200411 [Trichonephila clavipes]|nr:hypothetical protein TNCV_200411 [Trichonephila clavipes]
MPTSAIKDLLKKGEDVRAMFLEWHPYQADVKRFAGNKEVDNSEVEGEVQLLAADLIREGLKFTINSRLNNAFKSCKYISKTMVDFHKRILFSDEAHFWLNGYVNKQNYRIWSEANPQVYVETPLHPEKLTVWCTLWAGGILLQKR